MNLLELIKAAKKNLATEPVSESWGGTTKYVCFAVAEAYKELYGHAECDGSYDDVRRYIESKLRDLQDSLRVIGLAAFSESLAIAYLKSLGVKKEMWGLQQARHLWLD